jgi:hypothetical protein
MNTRNQLLELFTHLQLPIDPTASIGNRLVYLEKTNGFNIEIKTFSITHHGPMVHLWCNMAYSQRFWGMAGSYSMFAKECVKKIRNGEAMLYMFFLNKIPVACFEIYQVMRDILAKHVNARKEDYGIHFMLAPYREIILKLGNLPSGFSIKVLQGIIQYLFKSTFIENLYAEPDKENINACQLAEKAGFLFLNEISLPKKTVKLYCFSRDHYNNIHSTES